MIRTLPALAAIPLLALASCTKEEQPAPAPAQSAAESAADAASKAPALAAPTQEAPAGQSKPAAETPKPAAPAVSIPDPSEQVAQVTDALKTAMTDYMADLGEANDVLSDVQSAMSAAAASPKLAPIIDKLEGFKTQWDALDPVVKDQLTSMFRDRLQRVVDQVNQQIERIQNDPTLGPSLQSVLGDIPLIEF